MIFAPNVDGVIIARAENCDRNESDTYYWREVVTISGLMTLIPSKHTNDDTAAATLSFNARVPVAATYRLMSLVQYRSTTAWRWLHIDPNTGGSDESRATITLAAGIHRITSYGVNDFSIYDEGVGVLAIALVPAGVSIIGSSISEATDANDGTPELIKPGSFVKHEYPSERFTWTDNDSGANRFRFDVGSSVGASDYLSTAEIGNIRHFLFESSPLSGAYLYVRFHYRIAGVWDFKDYVIQSPRSPSLTHRYYETWLQDESREPYRLLLIEIDHNDGTIYLASKPWLSDENIPYDCFITSSPFMEYSISDPINVGDVEAMNPVGNEDWLDNQYSGFKCRWYFGDMRWPKSDFQQIASAVIENCRRIGDRMYRFELISDVQEYSKNVGTTAQTLNLNVEQAVAWAFNQFDYSGSYRFVDIPNADLFKNLRIEVDENTNAYTLVRKIAQSIGASTRPARSGYLEIFKFDPSRTSTIALTDDSIRADSIRLVETISPVKRVIINYDLGTKNVEVPTGYQVGVFDDELVIDSLLVDGNDATELAYEYALKYSSRQDTWELGITSLANIISVGQHADIFHSQLRQSGEIRRIRHTPLSEISMVEIQT